MASQSLSRVISGEARWWARESKFRALRWFLLLRATYAEIRMLTLCIPPAANAPVRRISKMIFAHTMFCEPLLAQTDTVIVTVYGLQAKTLRNDNVMQDWRVSGWSRSACCC